MISVTIHLKMHPYRPACLPACFRRCIRLAASGFIEIIPLTNNSKWSACTLLAHIHCKCQCHVIAIKIKMIKNLLSLSRGKKREKEKAKLKESFVPVSVVEKVDYDRNTRVTWVAQIPNIPGASFRLPSLPFQGPKKKPKIPRPYLLQEERNNYKLKRSERKRGSAEQFLPAHTVEQMAAYLNIEHVRSLYHIAVEALLNDLPTGWQHVSAGSFHLPSQCAD